jgi:uncharacterized membrane protein YeiB
LSINIKLSGGSDVEVAPQDSAKERKNERKNSQGAGRLLALDAARGLAVIGMLIAHFALNDLNALIVSGNTTLLFVLCGGISYSIMAQRLMNRGAEPIVFRVKMLARAVFIDIIGYSIIMLNTSIPVILPAYAVLFVLALVLVHRSTRVLVATAAILLLVSPPLMLIGEVFLWGAPILSDIAGGSLYSAVALAPAFVAGMAIGRIDLTKKRTALSLVFSGAIMLVVIKVVDIFVLNKWLISDRYTFKDDSWKDDSWKETIESFNAQEGAIWPLNVMYPPQWQTLLETYPHSGSTFQTMLGLGVAFLVLGLVFLISKKVSLVLRPFAAVGRVALTIYAGHFVLMWGLQLAGIQYNLDVIPFGDLIVMIVTVVTGWLLARLPNGPLEALMRRFDQVFSPSRSATVPTAISK